MSTPTTTERHGAVPPAPRRFTVLLAVTGGIAAYRAAELVRLLQKHDMLVRVVQTPASVAFVGPATFSALTGQPVRSDGDSFPHLDAARCADLLLVAPATANSLARFASGMADEIVSATYLGFSGPTLVCPAMNVRMWRHPATQRNVERLRADGVQVVEPETGRLACGDEGEGRLAALDRILATVLAARARASGGELDGCSLLVTAGGTSEPVDSVRVLANRSSGRMGVEIARAARARGANVRLVVTSTVESQLYADIEPAAVVATAQELEQAVRTHAADSDVVLMAAAVSDFAPEVTVPGKLDRRDSVIADPLQLRLRATNDILAGLGTARAEQRKRTPLLVGFAAETGPDGLARARAKRLSKRVDAIVYNDVSRSDIGFGAHDNEVVIIDAAGETTVPRAPKSEIAGSILDWVVQALRAESDEAAELTRR